MHPGADEALDWIAAEMAVAGAADYRERFSSRGGRCICSPPLFLLPRWVTGLAAQRTWSGSDLPLLGQAVLNLALAELEEPGRCRGIALGTGQCAFQYHLLQLLQ